MFDLNSNLGAIWQLFLDVDGKVKGHQKISATEGGFTGVISDSEPFGFSVAPLGDLDGDNVDDLIVGQAHDSDGGDRRGAVWVLFLGPFVHCPNDTLIQTNSTIPKLVLNGFTIINACTDSLTFDYWVTSEGPATLVDNGDSTSLAGTITLAAGASFQPPNAALEIPEIRNNLHQYVTYHVSAIEDSNIVDSCMTTITFDPPVAVFINSFTAKSISAGIELAWDIQSDEQVKGFKIFRKMEEKSITELINPKDLIPPDSRKYIDYNISAGQTYQYSLAVVKEDNSEITSQMVSIRTKAYSLILHQNYPNPFNPVTHIRFTLDQDGPVILRIYDTSGKLLRTLINRRMSSGVYSEEWDGRDKHGNEVASGIYFYGLKAGKRTLTRKAVFLK